MASDADEPKKPTETKKGMDKPQANSASQPAPASSGKGNEELKQGLSNIVNELKEIKDNDTTQRKEMVTALSTLTSSIKGSEETPEEKKEKKSSFSKAMEKLGETFKKGFHGFGNLKDLLKGSLGPLKTFWDAVKKVKKFILAFLGVFLLKNMTIDDVKKMWEGFKEVFISIKNLFIKMMEFLKPIWEWWIEEEGGFDQTVKLFKTTFEGFTKMLEEITEHFEGFQETGFKGKMIAITKTVESIGKFVLTFFYGVFDFVAAAFGYKSESGSITTDIGKYLDKTFSPGFMDGVKAVFNTIMGAMVIARVFGMPPTKFITKMSGMLWKSISRIFAVVFTSLGPVGWAIGLTALTIYYNKEITDALTKALDQVSNWFGNLGVVINNALVGTWLGDIFKLKKQEYTTVDEDTAKRHDQYRANLSKHEGTVQGLEEWKKLSAHQGTWAEAHALGEKLGYGRRLFNTDSGWFTQSKEMSALQNAKHRMKTAQGFVDSIPKTKEGKKPKEPVDGTITMTKPMPVVPQDDALSESLATLDKLRGKPSIAPSIELHEGWREKAYDDTEGFRTIGFGFNMDKPNAEALMKAAGITKNFKDLYEGKAILTKDEGRKLKDYEMDYFTASAKAWIGADKWAKMNVGAQEALVDMAYNMGGNFTGKKKDGTFKWKDLRKALRSGKMDAVGPAIKNSEYIKQVQPERSGANINALSKAYQEYDFNSDVSSKTKSMQDQIISQVHNNQNYGDNNSFVSTGGAVDGSNLQRKGKMVYVPPTNPHE